MNGTLLALRVVLSLACVVGLIWIMGRKMAGAQTKRAAAGPTMHVVGRQAIGRHAGVAVVAIGNRRLLLGYGEQQVTMLTELSPVHDVVTAVGATSAAASAPGGHGLTASLTGLVAGLGARRLGRARVQPVPTGLLADVPTPRTAIDVAALLAEADASRLEAAPLDTPANAPTSTPANAAAQAANAAQAAQAARAAQVAVGRLDGSILSPTTWRRAVGALQDRTVRR